MRDLHLGVTLTFNSELERRHSQDILMWLLGTVCRLNYLYLIRHPETPLLYDSGVRYTPPDQATAPQISDGQRRELFKLLQSMGCTPEIGQMVFRIVRGAETFLDIPNLYARKKGDCNELVPVRVAELWRAGIDASPYLIKPVENSNGGLTYHAVVYYPTDNSHEDPSLILGMGGKARAGERREEIRKNHERLGNFVSEAKRLIEAGQTSPDEIGQELDMMGLVPRDGFRA